MPSGSPSDLADFAYLRRTIPIASILRHYRLDAELKRVGSQLFMCCPIHKGTHWKQFVVDVEQNRWFCFGRCRRGGGSLDLVMEMENLDVRGAADLVCEWFAISPPQPAQDLSQPERRRDVSGKPSHKCYAVEDREVDPSENEGDDNKPFWTRIGSAWPHKDGKGLNIVLSALPINARLVLREYTSEDEKADAEKAKKQPQRYSKK